MASEKIELAREDAALAAKSLRGYSDLVIALERQASPGVQMLRFALEAEASVALQALERGLANKAKQ